MVVEKHELRLGSVFVPNFGAPRDEGKFAHQR
jgi:hypothetical protein